MSRFDPASLVAGLVISGLGVLLLLDQTHVIDLRCAYMWAALLAPVGEILLAVGLTGKRR